jgi:hypothetical protein
MIIIILLILSAIPRLWYILQPNHPWWDPSVYIGMGKYMFSHGTIGTWETLRPMLWPAILGSFWKLGLDPLFWGKFLQIVATLVTLYILYRLGERIHKHVGIIAATLLSATPAYFYFTVIPITDIPTTFLSLLGAYLLLNRKYYLSGLCVGIAFAMRFPHALFIVPFGLFTLLTYWQGGSFKATVIQAFKPLVRLGLGAAIIALPYLAINYAIYHDPLLPIIEGQHVASMITSLYFGPLYYFHLYFLQNPFIIFSLAGLMFYMKNFKRWREHPELTLSLICFMIVGGYFIQMKHKELRYFFPALPYLFLFTGYGIVMLIKYLPSPRKLYAGGILAGGVGIYMLALSALNIPFNFPLEKYGPPKSYQDFYSFPPAGSRVITTAPQITVYSDANIVDFFDTWENFYRVYTTHQNEIDYIALNSCNLTCTSPDCEQKRQALTKILTEHTHMVYSAQEGQCLLSIYKHND